MRKHLITFLAVFLLAAVTVGCNRNSNPPEKSATQSSTQQSMANPHAGVSAAPNKADDPMTEAMSKTAGSGATDCGHVPTGGDNTSASECAMEAFNDKKPFFVRYDLPMPDAQMAIATVRSADGKMFTMQFDSKGWEKAQEGGTLSADKKIGSVPCPKPDQLRIAGSGRVTCFPPTQMPSGMSPHGSAGGMMQMPPATGASPHGGGMAMPPASTPNPHKTDTTKAH